MTPAILSRRATIGGMAALLAACAALPPLSVDEAVRRLLRKSTERALAKLYAPGGVWDRFVMGLDLGGGVAGMVLQRALMSDDFHRRLDDWVRPIALRAAHAAAPRIAAAVKTMGIANARAVMAGGPRAATDMLRSEMGPAVVEAMVPEFRTALDAVGDPALARIFAALLRIGGDALAQKLAHHADDAVWGAIGDEEAAIRADPTAGGDPQLAAYLAHP
ncbi:DUF4197 family protein [Novosphingobium sp.]|uniref:DUF4197 family protein n=1 Tax=Novosphingobium sp. TaxID=1874826 RepID=UPI003D0BB3D1